MEKVDKQGASNAAHMPKPLAFTRYGNVKSHAFMIYKPGASLMKDTSDYVAAQVAIVEGLGNKTQAEQEENARLLTAAFNAFDSAAKKLGCTAIELAERMQEGGLAELVEALGHHYGTHVAFEQSDDAESEREHAIAIDKTRAVLAKVKGGADSQFSLNCLHDSSSDVVTRVLDLCAAKVYDEEGTA
jgi:hypothetical protein